MDLDVDPELSIEQLVSTLNKKLYRIRECSINRASRISHVGGSVNG